MNADDVLMRMGARKKWRAKQFEFWEDLSSDRCPVLCLPTNHLFYQLTLLIFDNEHRKTVDQPNSSLTTIRSHTLFDNG